MSLTSGELSAADVAAVMGNNGNGNGWGGDGSFWIVILFLFALMGGYGGNWGNGGGNGMMPFMMGNNDVQRGFDQSAVMNGITGLTSAVSNGFANAEVSRCNAQTNILQAMNTQQAATMQGMNSLAMSLQQCCCDNRASTADLKYTVATEACADRNAVQQAMNQLSNEYRQGNQAVLDKLCQLEMDGIKQNYENRIYGMQNTIDQLRSQINEGNRLASQTAQTAQILADNAAQTAQIENYLLPPVRPAYIVPNPNCCQQQWTGCGCGYNG